MLKNELIISFPSVHYAMRVEALLIEASIRFLLKPKPRWLTSECGLALSFESGNMEQREIILKESNILYVAIYEASTHNLLKEYEAKQN